jgi:predicted transcriptional regulator
VDETVETIERAVTDYVALTADLVSAYISNNRVQPSEVGALIASMHDALTGLARGAATAAPAVEKPTPAQIRKSMTPDALISFLDGKPYKTLKRHLTVNGMTIEQYRERFGLPRDYPSTAASYSAMRAEFARNAGLGHNRKKAAPNAVEPVETVSEKPTRAGRPRKAKEAAEA